MRASHFGSPSSSRARRDRPRPRHDSCLKPTETDLEAAQSEKTPGTRCRQAHARQSIFRFTVPIPRSARELPFLGVTGVAGAVGTSEGAEPPPADPHELHTAPLTPFDLTILLTNVRLDLDAMGINLRLNAERIVHSFAFFMDDLLKPRARA